MSERQNHGFQFEQYAKEKYDIELSKKYTSKFDGLYKGLPISIKCEKKGSDIELADYFRNAQIKEDFYLLVGFWESEKTNIIKEHLLLIKGVEYHALFNEKYEKLFKELLESVSNDKSDDEKWKQGRMSLLASYKKDTPFLIRPRFKRDHKAQKRIQCAINNKDFYSYFIPKYEVY